MINFSDDFFPYKPKSQNKRKKVSLLDMNDSEGNDPNSIPKAFSLKISYEVKIWFSFVLDFQLDRERSYCALRPFPWCHILIRKFQFSLAQERGGGEGG